MYQGCSLLFSLKRAIFSGALLVWALSSCLYAQKPNTDPTGDEKWARAYIMAGDFVTGLKEYLLLMKKDSANPEYNYNLAICYLNTSIDKTKAIPYIEFACNQPKMDPMVFYDLGRAYQYANRFDDAIDAYAKYRKMLQGEDPNYISATMQIEMCERAKEMVEHPVNVTFENLGSRINSPFPDYNPYVSRRENTLFFTSKRAGNIGNLIDFDGYYTADVFSVENKYGAWDKAKRLPPTINSPLVEETGGLSSDGNYLFVYADNLDIRLQLVYSRKTGRSFQRLYPMGTNVNLKDNGATAATISRDKKTLIFAAERPDGNGKSDLYLAKALPNGDWGIPQNLGKAINTQFDEEYPVLSFDGGRLYFASVGHGSMGGFDLFYSDWDSLTSRWSEPVNLGYPVNTADDDMQISFTASGRYAYKAELRPDGYGNLDIYRITFHDVEPAYTVVRGQLAAQDSSSIVEVFKKELKQLLDSLYTSIDSVHIAINGLDDTALQIISEEILRVEDSLVEGPQAVITVHEKNSGQLYGTYRPGSRTGRFAIALKPGAFTITVNADGFESGNTDIVLNDVEMNVKEINMNFTLTRKK